MDFTRADALNTAIRTIAVRHKAIATALLAELGLHPGHETLLLALQEHGPLALKQLADKTGCEPPNVTVMVRKLQTGGLITRAPGAEDAVTLTEKGRDLMGPLRRTWVRLAEETVGDLDADAVAEVLGGLELLAGELRSRGQVTPRPQPPTQTGR
ncbi:hypothetical protein Afil01_19070 [Actinorhabdospora filicis]|uniref:HTH marR-type domain-containing protein n=1 Tax=Actinorhabdospora filicis TaxID=1785913 RepID=A0A9W6SJI0_9ACTN|nr:MarR family winged helix-turn-helix transcriptional regulator [Actinorhabdospora filicis]GLZ77100.1 hypothetical protein Afil01_19070 [Actinorhabdospora filicis]